MAERTTTPKQQTEARVREILRSKHRNVSEKKMMGALAFMIDGAMCCSVRGDALLVRVTEEERGELLSKPGVLPMKLGQRTMSGFVRVDPSACRTEAALSKWLERGVLAARAKTR